MKIEMNRRNLIIGIVGAVVLVGLALVLVFNWDDLWSGKQEVSTLDPIDVTFDFYDPWLAAAQATSTNPFKEGLAKAPILSKELRKKIKNAPRTGAEVVDPVLCQTTTPADISARMVSQDETQAEVLILSRQKELTGQAVVKLVALNGGWYINDIVCSPGEFAPEREFTFEREGFLLKSVPPPYNPQYWHIVFEENGEKGHAAPLFFDAESTCKALDGKTAVCNPDQFREATKVLVKGSMSETGVQVKQLELMKE